MCLTVLNLKFINLTLHIDDLVLQVAEEKGIRFDGTDEENEAARNVLTEIIDETMAKFLEMGKEITVQFDFSKRTATVLKL